MAGCYGMTSCGLGEPKVYGGYGSGATDVQEAYRDDEYVEAAENSSGDARGTAGGKRVRVVDWKRVYPSVKAAAEALGVGDQVLGRRLRRNGGKTVVNGVVVEVAR